MTLTSTDRVHKQILLNAPPRRVWQALTDPTRFGQWFGVDIDSGTFNQGQRVSGRIRDPQYAHIPFDILVENVQPERRLAWRWHPHAIEPGADYPAEPTTSVVFELEEQADGTLLTIVESGFDALPVERRVPAYRGNEAGWTEQLQAIRRYVEQSA